MLAAYEKELEIEMKVVDMAAVCLCQLPFLSLASADWEFLIDTYRGSTRHQNISICSHSVKFLYWRSIPRRMFTKVGQLPTTWSADGRQGERECARYRLCSLSLR